MASRTLKKSDPEAKRFEELRIANEESTEKARAARRPESEKPADDPAPAKEEQS